MSKTKEDRQKENVCFRASDEWQKRIEEFAKGRGMNFSEAVRYLCELALDTMGKRTK